MASPVSLRPELRPRGSAEAFDGELTVEPLTVLSDSIELVEVLSKGGTIE